jgi:Trypsin-like peptidase domain
MMRVSKDCPSPACVVRVGDGRGFIIEQRVKRRPLPPRLRKRWPSLGRWHKYITRRLVVTAAHCLPKLPPACVASYTWERTYTNLLGTLSGKKTSVSAECLFVDPVADIAVLGSPDSQEMYDQADAYDALTEEAPILRIGKPRSGRGWLLALDGHWIPTSLDVFFGEWGASLNTGPTEGGMSGSPVLNYAGRAIGVVVIGCEVTGKNERAGPQSILVHSLPGWLLCGRTRGQAPGSTTSASRARVDSI